MGYTEVAVLSWPSRIAVRAELPCPRAYCHRLSPCLGARIAGPDQWRPGIGSNAVVRNLGAEHPAVPAAMSQACPVVILALVDANGCLMPGGPDSPHLIVGDVVVARLPDVHRMWDLLQHALADGPDPPSTRLARRRSFSTRWVKRPFQRA